MATYDEAHHVVTISDDEVRSGVTGHNVRYVLAFGMTGVILAFAAIAVYFGYDALHARLTTALAHSPFEFVRAIAAYAVTLLVGAIAIGLLLGLWTMVSGPSEDASQTFMRLRVVTQFVLVCLILVLMSHTIV
jgi:uncharacterized membrane protein